MGNTSVCEIICISFALLVLADNLEWWNIVPHESESLDRYIGNFNAISIC